MEQTTNKETKQYWVITDYVYNIFGRNEHIAVYLFYGKKTKPKFVSERLFPSARKRKDFAHAAAGQHVQFLMKKYEAEILEDKLSVDV